MNGCSKLEKTANVIMAFSASSYRLLLRRQHKELRMKPRLGAFRRAMNASKQHVNTRKTEDNSSWIFWRGDWSEQDLS